MISSNELNIRLDDELRDALDAYAVKFFKKPNNAGNRSEAARHLLSSIFKLEALPSVSAVLDDLVINGDINIFIRVAVGEYLATMDKDSEHTLQ